MAAVEIRDLVVRYGAVTAVDGLSMTADRGAITAVIGPNGAGKTSTIETLEGYRTPAAGTARVLGLDPIAGHGALRGRIGVVLQSGGVYPTMNARDAMRLFAAYYDDPVSPDGLLERLGLAPVAGTPWRQLSGGEQRRLALGLALVGRPTVAFLDEPTAGVDPSGRIVIREVVRELRDAGVAVILTTHELDEAQRVADTVVIIDRGRVVADGTVAELTGSGGAQTVRFGAPPNIDIGGLSQRLGATVVESTPGEYQVDAAGTPQVVAAITAWLAERDLPLGDLRAARESLEDVFLRLTGDDGVRP